MGVALARPIDLKFDVTPFRNHQQAEVPGRFVVGMSKNTCGGGPGAAIPHPALSVKTVD
jgi:hypothetical protein